MRRAVDELPWVVGVLIIGLLVGSRLGPGSTLWSLVLALGVVSIGVELTSTVLRSRRGTGSPERRRR